MDKPKPYRRPLSHNLKRSKESFKRFFTSAPSNSLQTWSAIFTIFLGAASFIISLVVYNSKQEIQDMEKVISSLDSQNQKQNVTIEQLKNIALKNQAISLGIDSLNRKTLKTFEEVHAQTNIITINDQANIVIDSFNIVELSQPNTCMLYIYYGNKGRRNATDVNIDMKIFSARGSNRDLYGSIKNKVKNSASNQAGRLSIFTKADARIYTSVILNFNVNYFDAVLNKRTYSHANYYAFYFSGKFTVLEFGNVQTLNEYKKTYGYE